MLGTYFESFPKLEKIWLWFFSKKEKSDIKNCQFHSFQGKWLPIGTNSAPHEFPKILN
jgi:hypothetical protein